MAVCTMDKTTILLVLQLLLLVNYSESVNLDTRFSLLKKGEDNTYFGFSVAQHQVLDAAGNVKKNVLFIGAPKHNITANQYGPLEQSIGGGLFMCDARTRTRDCDMIMNEGLVYEAANNEIVSDQWMGVSVASEGPGGMAMGCAHRYIKDNGVPGFCYSLKQDFTQDPNSGKIYPCEKFGTTTLFMNDNGLCQAGISATIAKDQRAIVGAPGSVFWRGTIFTKNITTVFGIDEGGSYAPFVDQKKDENNQSEKFEYAPTNRYSYNGYSVEFGNFDGMTDYYVSGAPRGQYTGQVVLYIFNATLHHSKNSRTKYPKLRYQDNWILKGDRPFSGFGSSLLAVDLNKDGMDELIVGAPYYYERQENRYYGGAIYVYPGKKNFFEDPKPTLIKSRSMSIEECEEIGCQHASFGMSLAKLGDINMDGFQDFAVGAPYEGNGAIYIYHGSEEGFKHEFVQKIAASSLPEFNLKSFGYSLSGGLDLDENGYPDLLVGAYESDAVVLLRSRPIINLYATATNDEKPIDQDNPSCVGLRAGESNGRNCITIDICVLFTTKPMDSITDLPSIMYTLEAEKGRQVARVELYGENEKNLDNNKKILKNQLFNLGVNIEKCKKHYAYVKLKNEFQDRYRNITFTFNFKINNTNELKTQDSRGTQDVNKFPELVIAGNPDIETQVPFVRECTGPCNSNLELTTKIKDKDEDLKLDGAGYYEMISKTDNTLEVTIDVSNSGEPAYQTAVILQKPEGLDYRGVSYKSKETLDCEEVEDLIMCPVGNPLKKQVVFTVKFDVNSVIIKTDVIFNITANVTTLSDEENKDNDQKVLLVKVVNKADIYLSANVNPDYSIMLQGSPRDSNAITDEKDIGVLVSHDYIVRNRGPGVVPTAWIKIQWPMEVTNPKTGKYLLYMIRKPEISGKVIQCFDYVIANFTNPETIKEHRPIVPARRKREADPSAKRDVLVFNCKDGSAKCFTLTCNIGPLRPGIDNFKISMEARLWESTMLSDYSDKAEVQIVSSGKVWIKEEEKITQDETNDEKDVITKVQFKKTLAQAVKWWIILVAVLAGLVVLLVLILILYKIGFFKRKRQEDMKLYQAEKKHQGMLTEFDED